MRSCLTKEGQKAAADINANLAQSEFDLREKPQPAFALQDQLKKGGAAMSDDAKNKLARQIDADGNSLQRDADDLNADAEQEQNKVFQDMIMKLNAVVAQYATQNGYAVVLDVSNQQSPILWAAASTDITSDIVKLYDQAHPVAAGAPAAEAAGASRDQKAVKTGGESDNATKSVDSVNYFFAGVAADVNIRSISVNSVLPSKTSFVVTLYTQSRWIMPLASIRYTCGYSRDVARTYE